MAKYQLDYLVAKLGSSDKRRNFFEDELEVSAQKQEHTISLQRISDLTNTLIEHLQAQNQIAFLQAQIDELAIEKSYFQKWHEDAYLKDKNNQVLEPHGSFKNVNLALSSDIKIFSKKQYIAFKKNEKIIFFNTFIK